MKIFSVHSVRTDLLEWQVNSLRHFVKDDYDFYCLDNFIEKEKSDFIKNKCDELNVNWKKFDYPLGRVGYDHINALNSIKHITTDDEINVIIDGDVFLIDNFSFLDCIDGYDIAGMYNQRHNFECEYLTPLVLIFNKNKSFSSVEFDGDKKYMTDVCGKLHSYIKDKRVKFLKHTSALDLIGDDQCFSIPYDPKFGVQIIENSLLHAYRFSNWSKDSAKYNYEKTEWVKNALKESKQHNILNSKYLDQYQTVYSHSFCHWNGMPYNRYKSALNPYLDVPKEHHMYYANTHKHK